MVLLQYLELIRFQFQRTESSDKVNLDNLDEKFNISTIQDKDSNVSTKVYQFEVLTPEMAGLKLNMIVMIHTHLITKQVSRNIIFTNDMSLEALKCIMYYSLRFQIEFDFRDAKQFYGLSDFENYKQTQITNAVNIAFTMTVVGKLVLEKYKLKLDCPSMGIIDLKAVFRTQKCAEILSGGEPLNSINLDPYEFLSSPQFLKIARLEVIHI